MIDNVFSSKDIALLSRGLALVPELEFAVYMTKLARETLGFPVKTIDDLEPAFKGLGGTIKHRRWIITLAQAGKFIPARCFPILDEYQFLSTIALSVSIATNHHRRGRARLQSKKAGLVVHFPPGLCPESLF